MSNYPGIGEVGHWLDQTSERDQIVNDARRLAQTSKSAWAVEAFRRAMGGQPTSPELRSEYYQVLSATLNGWDEARKGLEELARENPDDPGFAHAYAQHLMYRHATPRHAARRGAMASRDTSNWPATARLASRRRKLANATREATAQQEASTQTFGVARELAQINREQASTVSGGVVFRNRTGEDGVSNPKGASGRLTVTWS